MRALPLLLLLPLLAARPAAAQNAEIMFDIPARYHEGVERALLGANDDELRASFRKLEAGDERIAWAFLVAYLPPDAVLKLTDRVLTGQVMYAMRSWRGLPWAKGVSKEMFHHYLLPFVLEYGKPKSGLAARFDKVVPDLRRKRVETLEQAALEVNRICAKRGGLGVLPDERAREFVRFARAAGIPARVAFTPYWTHKAGGHAWCEVFDGTRWRFLEPGKPSGKLDRVSFGSDLSRVALVLSRTIGKPEEETVVATEEEFALVNSTALYTKACRMTVEVKREDGRPARGASVCLYLFNDESNNAHIRPALTGRAGEDGRFSFDVGPGDHLFHADAGASLGFGVARARPGGTAVCAIPIRPPVTDPSSTYRKSGATALTLHLGSGGGGDMTAALARLRATAWDFFGFVGGGGLSVDLDPGWYVVSTSWRRSETVVVVSIQTVEVRADETVSLTTPDFPKSSRKPQVGANAFVLTFPRR